MTVNAIYSAQDASATGNQTQPKKQTEALGKDSFLQLLVTQMRYQDPLEPAKDTEYISQLAQFNSLEQMQNLNDKFDQMLKWSQLTQSSNLIGKQIDGLTMTGEDQDGDGNADVAKVSGAVKEVKFVGGEPILMVGSTEVKLSDIARIY
ncbi:MAG: flagellar hook assembly protein FlgD [Candidatus Aquicultor sp.]